VRTCVTCKSALISLVSLPQCTAKTAQTRLVFICVVSDGGQQNKLQGDTTISGCLTSSSMSSSSSPSSTRGLMNLNSMSTLSRLLMLVPCTHQQHIPYSTLRDMLHLVSQWVVLNSPSAHTRYRYWVTAAPSEATQKRPHI
jgi:hypothetical protein